MKATNEQLIVGALVILGIFLISFLVTRYTKYGGGSNYGTGDPKEDDDDDIWLP